MLKKFGFIKIVFIFKVFANVCQGPRKFCCKTFLLILVHNWQGGSASSLLLPVKIKQHTNLPTSEVPKGSF